jgi:integrase
MSLMKYTPYSVAGTAFLEALAVERELEPATIKNYRTNLKKCEDWIRETFQTVPRIEHFTEENLRTYLASRQVSDGTHHNIHSRLSQFGNWLVENRYLDANPMLKVKRRKSNNRVRARTVFPMERKEELAAIGAALHPRNEALFLFYCASGRRQQEALAERVKDLDFNSAPGFPCGRYTFIEFKKGGSRVTKPMDPQMNEFLSKWLVEYKRLAVAQGLLSPWQDLPGEWYLFPAFKQGTPLRRMNPTRKISNLWTLINPILKQMGVYQRGAGTHALRRAAADYLAQRAGIRAAKNLLNHKEESQTEEYLDRKREDIQLAQDLQMVYGQPAQVSQKQDEAHEEDQTSTNVVSIFRRRSVQTG